MRRPLRTPSPQRADPGRPPSPCRVPPWCPVRPWSSTAPTAPSGWVSGPSTPVPESGSWGARPAAPPAPRLQLHSATGRSAPPRPSLPTWRAAAPAAATARACPSLPGCWRAARVVAPCPAACPGPPLLSTPLLPPRRASRSPARPLRDAGPYSDLNTPEYLTGEFPGDYGESLHREGPPTRAISSPRPRSPASPSRHAPRARLVCAPPLTHTLPPLLLPSSPPAQAGTLRVCPPTPSPSPATGRSR
jgi:hypothetical protein